MNAKQRAATAALAAAALLAGCGGGGGGGGAPIQVPQGQRIEDASANSNVSSGNFVDLAGPLVRLIASSSGNPVQGSVDTSSSAQALAAPKRAKPLASAVAGTTVLRNAMRALAKQTTRRTSALAVTTNIDNCPGGGTQTTIVDDADNDGLPSPGDSVTIRFNDCQIDNLALPANGSFSFTIDDVDLFVRDNNDFNVLGIIAVGNFDQLSIDGLASMDGAFKVWWTVDDNALEEYRVAYAQVHAVTPDEDLTYDVDIEGQAQGSIGKFAIDGALGIGNQTYKVVQGDFFRSDRSALPDSGDISMEDARGDQLHITARPNEVLDLEYIPADPNGTVLQSPGYRWSDFGV